MTTAETSGAEQKSRRSELDLDRRYGRIAISALVAALPYGSECKQADTVEDRKDRAA
ncbi:hypothetical protein [Pseudorhodoplanes sp.]|uniref:hypothetical protein n=1 Tax=Pseudorhodoplanes sp. TaxID=1934341 RepID=UPI002B98B399|nr:hypothetical protein [Pseudorhodoplanes sp.]HWV40797.1 hypothetical protein [Pseudorhodoplanes sp.]